MPSPLGLGSATAASRFVGVLISLLAVLSTTACGSSSPHQAFSGLQVEQQAQVIRHNTAYTNATIRCHGIDPGAKGYDGISCDVNGNTYTGEHVQRRYLYRADGSFRLLQLEGGVYRTIEP